MPRIVKAPLPFAPHNCLATGRDDGELIDFEADANINEPFPHVVLMRGVVEEAARDCCQMVSAAEVDALRLQVEGFAEKVAELQADLDAAKAFEERFGEKELEGKSLVIPKDEWHLQEEIEIAAATASGPKED
jgi:hypothetical protein